MSSRAARFPLVLGLLGFQLVAGCVSFTRGYVEKRYYALHAPRGSVSSAATGDTGPIAEAVLSVRTFSGGPGLEGPQLVHRVAEGRYEADFYNEFFVPPGDFVTAAVRRWMADSGLFRVVLEPGSLAEADYVLEGGLTELFSDDREERSFAVLEIQVFLTKTKVGGPEVVFHREYAEREPLEGNEPDELVAAMSRALTRILFSCEADLATYLRAAE